MTTPPTTFLRTKIPAGLSLLCFIALIALTSPGPQQQASSSWTSAGTALAKVVSGPEGLALEWVTLARASIPYNADYLPWKAARKGRGKNPPPDALPGIDRNLVLSAEALTDLKAGKGKLAAEQHGRDSPRAASRWTEQTLANLEAKLGRKHRTRDVEVASN